MPHNLKCHPRDHIISGEKVFAEGLSLIPNFSILEIGKIARNPRI